MSILWMGSAQAGAQVTLAPLPYTQHGVPSAHPGPVAQADVSSLGKGLAHPGRRPMPVGTIRQRADGTNSC